MKKKIKIFSIFHVQGCYVVSLFRVSGLLYNNMLQKPVKTTEVCTIQTYKTGNGKDFLCLNSYTSNFLCFSIFVLLNHFSRVSALNILNKEDNSNLMELQVMRMGSAEIFLYDLNLSFNWKMLSNFRYSFFFFFAHRQFTCCFMIWKQSWICFEIPIYQKL